MLSGVINSNGSLALYACYSRSYYTLTITFDIGLESVSVSSDGLYGEATIEGNTLTAQIKHGFEVTITYGNYTAGYGEAVISGVSLTSSTETGGTFNMTMSNLALQITTSQIQYYITFVTEYGGLNGSTSEQTYTQAFTYQQTQNLTANKFVYTGYVFVRWAIYVGEISESTKIGTWLDGSSFTFDYLYDLIAVAEWTPATDTAFTISYKIKDINGNVGDVIGTVYLTGTTDETITQEDAENGLLQLYNIDFSGYEFGYFEEEATILPDGTGSAVVVLTLISYNVTVILQGEYEDTGFNSVSISYTNGTDTITVNDESTAQVEYTATITITISIAEGYNFSRIVVTGNGIYETYSTLSGGVFTYTMPASDINITIETTAQLVQITYYRNFEDNDTTTTTQTVPYGTEYSLTGSFSISGYTLVGWSTEKDATTATYSVGENMGKLTTTSNFTYYAVWEANDYTINYNANGGYVITTVTTMAKFNEAIELASFSNFSYTGRNLVAWSTSSETETAETISNIGDYKTLTEYLQGENKDGGIYVFNGTYYAYNLTTLSNGSVLIYAIWQEITYTVQLGDEKGVNVTQTLGTYSYLETVTIPSFDSLGWTEPAGYGFSGWYYYDNDGNMQQVLCDTSTSITLSMLTATDNATVVIYARWSLGMISISIEIVLEDIDGEYTTEIITVEEDKLDGITLEYEIEQTLDGNTAYKLFLEGTYYDNIEGYEYNKELSQLSSVYVTSSGGTIKVYYSRQYYTLTISWDSSVESIRVTSTESGLYEEGYEYTTSITYTIRYGDIVNISATASTGYEDLTLTSNDTTVYDSNGTYYIIMEAGNVIITASASPSANTSYTVNIFLQNIDLTYPTTESFTVPMSGTTGVQLDEDEIKTYVESLYADRISGFKYAVMIFTNNDGKIAGDGSTVVEIRYTRNSYTITLDVQETDSISSISSNETTYLYETKVTLEYIVNVGYNFDEDNVTLKDSDGENVEIEFSSINNEDGTYTITIIFTMPASDVTLTLSPEAEDVEYKIIYMIQTVDLQDYEEYDGGDPIVKTAKTGTILVRDDIDYGEYQISGFSVNSTSLDDGNVKVAGDGSTVVYIYYNRLPYNVTIVYDDEDGGFVQGSVALVVNGDELSYVASDTWEVAYGQTFVLTLEVSAGYTFDGFYIDGTLVEGEEYVNGTTLTYIMGDNDLEITVVITANTDTPYTVEYYQQNVGSDNEFTLYYKTEFTGKTNTQFTSEELEERFITNIQTAIDDYSEDMFYGFDYSYFTASAGEVDISYDVYISGDGQTVIKFYFIRKMVNVTIECDYSQVESVSGTGTYQFGATVDISAVMLPGYDFVSWQITEDLTLYDIDTSFVITSIDEYVIQVISTYGTAEYTVEYYLEIVDDGGYQLYEDPDNENPITYEGITESLIDVDSLMIEIVGYENPIAENATYYIAGDGSTVVKIYYSLITVEFYVKVGTGIESISVEGLLSQSDFEEVGYDTELGVYVFRAKYTKQINLQVVEMEGYKFDGWILDDAISVLDGSDEPKGYTFTVLVESFTLTANASEKSVTIIYNPNSDGAVIEETVKYNQVVNLRTNTFENGSKIFVGWAYSQNGDVAFFDGDQITIDFEDTLVLYAIWVDGPVNLWWLWIILIIIALILICVGIYFLVRKKKEKKMKYMSKQ